MVVEVMTIITFMTHPVYSTNPILPRQNIYQHKPARVQQPITAHLTRALKEHKMCEFIATSA